MPVPVVTTPRLDLRAFRSGDLDPFARASSDPEVMRYVGNGRTVGRDDTWRAMALYLGHWELRGYGPWAVEERATGHFVGRVGLWHPEGWPDVELIWLLDRAVWGRGLATEAAAAAATWAFAHRDLAHLVSYVVPDNVASARLAARLGARNEGRAGLGGVEVDVWRHPRPAAPAPSATGA